MEGHSQRKKLMVLGENFGEACEGKAGLNAKSEVAGVVGGDAVEASHVDGEVVA